MQQWYKKAFNTMTYTKKGRVMFFFIKLYSYTEKVIEKCGYHIVLMWYPHILIVFHSCRLWSTCWLCWCCMSALFTVHLAVCRRCSQPSEYAMIGESAVATRRAAAHCARQRHKVNRVPRGICKTPPARRNKSCSWYILLFFSRNHSHSFFEHLSVFPPALFEPLFVT